MKEVQSGLRSHLVSDLAGLTTNEGFKHPFRLRSPSGDRQGLDQGYVSTYVQRFQARSDPSFAQRPDMVTLLIKKESEIAVVRTRARTKFHGPPSEIDSICSVYLHSGHRPVGWAIGWRQPYGFLSVSLGFTSS
jgi:hypothetical protein